MKGLMRPQHKPWMEAQIDYRGILISGCSRSFRTGATHYLLHLSAPNKVDSRAEMSLLKCCQARTSKSGKMGFETKNRLGRIQRSHKTKLGGKRGVDRSSKQFEQRAS